ncbi:MAG: hypothetical protein ACOC56_04445 [Atribacterota bacterium]
MNSYIRIFEDNAFNWFESLSKAKQKKITKDAQNRDEAVITAYCNTHSIRIE